MRPALEAGVRLRSQRGKSVAENELLSRTALGQPHAIWPQTNSLQLVMGECILSVRVSCKKERRGSLEKSQLYACRHQLSKTALGRASVSAEKRGEDPRARLGRVAPARHPGSASTLNPSPPISSMAEIVVQIVLQIPLPS